MYILHYSFYICWNVKISLLCSCVVSYKVLFWLRVQLYLRTFFTKAKFSAIFWDFTFKFFGNTLNCPNCYTVTMTRGKNLFFCLFLWWIFIFHRLSSLCNAVQCSVRYVHALPLLSVLFIENRLSLLDICFFWNIFLMQVWLK